VAAVDLSKEEVRGIVGDHTARILNGLQTLEEHYAVEEHAFVKAADEDMPRWKSKARAKKLVNQLLDHKDPHSKSRRA
jgi:hypothetical protein